MPFLNRTLQLLFRRKWLKGHIPYYSNSDDSINFLEFCITLSGYVHPLPDPEKETKKAIPVCTGRHFKRNNVVLRSHIKSNCVRPTVSTNSPVLGNHNKQLTITHLNAESPKNRQHFQEVSEMTLQKQYDVLTISETWFNSTVTNISVEIKGYQIFRLDRLGKTGAGVCAYVRHVV